MRNRFLMSGATMAVTVIIASVIAVAAVEDDYDERLDELEDRVTRLEEAVGIDTSSSPRASTGGGEDGASASTSSSSASVSSSSSSSSSSGQSSGDFSGSYASSGAGTVELDLPVAGTYRLTVSSDAAVSVRLVAAGDEEVPEFAITSETGEEIPAEGRLEAGAYILEVEATAPWIVHLDLIGE